MFVLEKPTLNDKDLYNKISGGCWYEGAKWGVDRERGYYIILTGKRGVETPYFFYMNYKDEVIEIWVWDLSDIYCSDGFEDIVVRIPDSLSNDTDDIARIIRDAYSDDVFGNLDYIGISPPKIKEIRFKVEERKL